ncbi:MAG: hydroxymethylglutaryl-CoA reductase, degradative [Deltaproteobacteria bacterium]|nr:hydroxymethylglutaryl-CoA reductase, degradative [Deltaproteobacteria bacterium]
MSSTNSRLPGFYKLTLTERRARLAELTGLDRAELDVLLEGGGLDARTADKVVENVVGIYGLPLGVALNFRINDVDRLIPMVVEEPSVIAAASNAARMIRGGGGFRAELLENLMTTQIQLFDVPDPEAARVRLVESEAELLALATASVPNLVKRGGGPRAMEVRDLGERSVVVHVHVDCQDAMGANLVNTVAEAIGPRAAELGGGTLGLRILTNLSDRRRVRVRCRVPAAELVSGRPPSKDALSSWAPGGGDLEASTVLDRVVAASRFAEVDPYRAATHNKGIMNGVDSVVIATGNDYRAVEAGAHAFAARSGRYSPLAVWRREGDDLTGELEMPLALGIVGGTLRVHPTARLALELLGARTAGELALAAASAGLASNLAALRAMATEGIQRGHMSLHARSVAIAAGAEGALVEQVAAELSAAGSVTVDAAREVLLRLRRGGPA